MRAGALRHRVVLQRAADTINDVTGGSARSYTDIGSWRCEIKPGSTREGLIDGGVRADADLRLIGRRNSAVESMRPVDRAVSADGLTFYNLAGLPEASNDNRQIVLRVRTGMNDGS